MQPDNQHPIDYLDSIATVPKGGNKGVSDKLFFGVIIGGILTALLVGIFALTNSGPNTKSEFERLSVKLEKIQAIADDSQKNIVSSNLRGINTNLSLILANANHDASEIVAAHGIDPEKISPRITQNESSEEILNRLEDARLNATFDRTYARELSYELEMLIVLIGQLEAKTDHSSSLEFLKATRESMEPLQQQFSEFSATTS